MKTLADMEINNRLFTQNRANFAAQLPPKSIAVFTANESMPRNGDEFYPFRQQRRRTPTSSSLPTFPTKPCARYFSSSLTTR